VRLTILASGSAGNALVVETGRTRVLCDAGLPLKILAGALEAAFGAVPRFDAVLVTHAHGDHAAHAGRTAAMLDVPLWMTEATRRSIRVPATVRTRVFGAKASFDIGDLAVHPLPVPHDAPQIALVFEAGRARAGLATDLGEVPPSLAEHFATCDTVLIESNYDPDMLDRGPYPVSLRRRIASARGHLSNAQCAGLLRALSPATRRVVLMHLSEHNNQAALAREIASDALGLRDVSLEVAPRRGLLAMTVAGGAAGAGPGAGALAVGLRAPRQLALAFG